jgi:predicted glycosyltransferase
MRIWVDLTASAHPVVLRPVIERLRARGHEVDVTARDFAQTVELCRILGLDAEVFGTHGGASRVGKVQALVGRTLELRRWAKGRGFELAVGHGSNDIALAAKALRIPAVDAFDYEYAVFQHNIGARLAKRVIVPDAIPPERLKRYGVGPKTLRQYPGLKEEYYLADFTPDTGLLARLGIDDARVVVVVRPPPDVADYHRLHNDVFPALLERLGRDEGVHALVLPRTPAQRDRIRGLGLPSLIVPDGAVDGQSAVALADLVLSAGGSMNREAVALGTPVYTTFEGKMGGVDEQLLREGRLRTLRDAGDIELVKKTGGGGTERRDPELLVDLVLGPPSP